MHFPTTLHDYKYFTVYLLLFLCVYMHKHYIVVVHHAVSDVIQKSVMQTHTHLLLLVATLHYFEVKTRRGVKAKHIHRNTDIPKRQKRDVQYNRHKS